MKESKGWISPEVAWINLTDSCNLRCAWCYANSRVTRAQFGKVDIHNIHSLVRSLAECGISHVVFIGGEPTCSPLLPDLIGWARDEGLGASIATNGLALSNSKYCKMLKDKGLLSANISVKGFSREEYLLNTGVDGFGFFLRSVEIALSEGIDLTVSLVLMPENVKGLVPFLESLERRGVEKFLLSFERSEVCGEAATSGSAERAAETLVEFERSYLNISRDLRRKIDIELSYPRCVWDKGVLDLIESEGATSSLCHVHTGNGIVVGSAGELLLCNALTFPSLGQWGQNIFSAEDILSAYSSDICSNVLDDLLRFPSLCCTDCEESHCCFGGCPIQWFAYDLDELRCAVNNKRRRV